MQSTNLTGKRNNPRQQRNAKQMITNSPAVYGRVPESPSLIIPSYHFSSKKIKYPLTLQKKILPFEKKSSDHSKKILILFSSFPKIKDNC